MADLALRAVHHHVEARPRGVELLIERRGRAGDGRARAPSDDGRERHRRSPRSPAMAEVIIKETVSERAWSATIVDLAVRGFVKIEEIPVTRMERIGQGIIMVVFLVAAVLFLKGSGMPWQLGIVVFSIWFLRSGMRWFMNPGQGFVWVPKNYRVVRFPEVSGEKLEEYERQFLDILFPDGRMEFSTKDIRKSSRQTERQRMHAALLKLQVTLLEETAIDTSAYAVGFKAWRFAKIGLIVGAGAVLVLSMTLGQAAPLVIIPLLLASYFVTWAILFFRYNPRLNRQGQIFREEWLGFKLYLETAEKYRLQNLTPETFERYLPYAIIFGAEKKWGRAFSGIAIEPPRWYGGTSGMNGAMGAGFSAASFTSSFGASFSSAFSSAGGGASSGGGSAGGHQLGQVAGQALDAQVGDAQQQATEQWRPDQPLGKAARAEQAHQGRRG